MSDISDTIGAASVILETAGLMAGIIGFIVFLIGTFQLFRMSESDDIMKGGSKILSSMLLIFVSSSFSSPFSLIMEHSAGILVFLKYLLLFVGILLGLYGTYFLSKKVYLIIKVYKNIKSSKHYLLLDESFITVAKNMIKIEEQLNNNQLIENKLPNYFVKELRQINNVLLEKKYTFDKIVENYTLNIKE